MKITARTLEKTSHRARTGRVERLSEMLEDDDFDDEGDWMDTDTLHDVGLGSRGALGSDDTARPWR
ncbi:MAG: hypothetical protein KIT17_00220 [Rubrivivax sp.]|nr:hypothetical protein [Rubrivivax sp.]